jgi:two-component system, OmpR family, response regulator
MEFNMPGSWPASGETHGNHTVAPKILKVLLVEDSGVLVERLSELFAQMPGVDLVATVDTEAKAIAALADGTLDAIVLDLQLKGGTGFGVLRHIATLGRRPATIILTNYDLPEYRRQAAALGARYFLDKARDYDRLVDVLGEIRASAA